jgi:threonine aldolase
VFYIGGTKVGALFGEAVVISNKELARDFRYLIKQRGGMLAKGRLLGVQFDALMEDGLYFEIAKKADAMADQIRASLRKGGYPLAVEGITNQIFPILPDKVLAELEKKYVFCPNGRIDETHSSIRICTSWATTQEAVDALCADLEKVYN